MSHIRNHISKSHIPHPRSHVPHPHIKVPTVVFCSTSYILPPSDENPSLEPALLDQFPVAPNRRRARPQRDFTSSPGSNHAFLWELTPFYESWRHAFLWELTPIYITNFISRAKHREIQIIDLSDVIPRANSREETQLYKRIQQLNPLRWLESKLFTNKTEL